MGNALTLFNLILANVLKAGKGSTANAMLMSAQFQATLARTEECVSININHSTVSVIKIGKALYVDFKSLIACPIPVKI